ncbi:MAG TPA: SMP-30/gluconolactonase/LRE family protein [Chitinophagaceae bacterium]
MNKAVLSTFILFLSLPVSPVYCQQANAEIMDSLHLIAPGATLKKVSGGFTFTEGPAVDKKGNIYFTDQPNDRIWKYSTNGKLSLFMEKTGRSNGLYIDRKGNLVSCADENNELWLISPAKKVTILLSGFQGHRFNGPNDLWIDSKGGIYFTDPYYQRDYWDRKEPDIKSRNVYYLPKGKKEAILVEDGLVKPNGIVGTPDGRTLYVADIAAGKTYSYTILSDGSLADKKLVIQQGSDGMTLDNKGNIYLVGQGVTIYNPDGIKIGHIPVSASWTANICFGGRNRHTLFITAGDAVYTIQMKVKGVE